MSAGKDAEGVPGATTKKVVLVCPYASCLGFSGRSQRKPTLGDAGSVQASRGDVRSARSGEGGQGRMHGEAVTCHLSKDGFWPLEAVVAAPGSPHGVLVAPSHQLLPFTWI